MPTVTKSAVARKPAKAGVAPKTAIVDLKTINVAFRRAENYGTILKNPVAAVRVPREASDAEREALLHRLHQRAQQPHRRRLVQRAVLLALAARGAHVVVDECFGHRSLLEGNALTDRARSDLTV